VKREVSWMPHAPVGAKKEIKSNISEACSASIITYNYETKSAGSICGTDPCLLYISLLSVLAMKTSVVCVRSTKGMKGMLDGNGNILHKLPTTYLIFRLLEEFRFKSVVELYTKRY
jgi:hypothetical protein